jgi:DNA-binding HxlR family transcriptional regulator
MLRLLGAGAPVAILAALGKGPLRTKQLTALVPGYTPRTIYRHVPKLVDLDLVERDEEAGGGHKVVHALTPERGRELYVLIERFATASAARLPRGQIRTDAWESLGRLADLWEAGVIGELSRGPRSPTELARELNGLSYHQLSRRAGSVNTAGYLGESKRSAGRLRSYALTGKARRTMGLIAGIGCWRRRHEPGEGMGLEEIATVLRAALPLAELPQHAGKRLSLYAVGGDSMAEVAAEVARDGTIRIEGSSPEKPAGWAEGSAHDWCKVLLDGRFEGFTGDDERLVADCLEALRDAVWAPAPF